VVQRRVSEIVTHENEGRVEGILIFLCSLNYKWNNIVLMCWLGPQSTPNLCT
jgi:hypothetical protein